MFFPRWIIPYFKNHTLVLNNLRVTGFVILENYNTWKILVALVAVVKFSVANPLVSENATTSAKFSVAFSADEEFFSSMPFLMVLFYIIS